MKLSPGEFYVSGHWPVCSRPELGPILSSLASVHSGAATWQADLAESVTASAVRSL